jgi:hypothetical protein
MMNMAKRVSRKINTHRLGRESGLSRWYSLPLHRIMMESQTATIPNTARGVSRMNVPFWENIVEVDYTVGI